MAVMREEFPQMFSLHSHVEREVGLRLAKLYKLYGTVALLFTSVLNLSRLVSQLTLLLLLSGDVETNPGPTNTLSIAEYADLVTLPNIDSKWMEFGVQLCIEKSSLDAIKRKHGKSLNRCKQEMFRLAVQGGITWEKVLFALQAIGFIKEELRDVCDTIDVEPVNGLSDFLDFHHEEPKLPSDDNGSQKQDIPATVLFNEHEIFKSFQSALLSIFQSESLLLANAMYSNGIITQEDLHKFRVISSNKTKATVLFSLIEAALLESPFKFQGFITALHSVSSASSLSEKISRAYRFNQVRQKMVKTSDTELDLNHLSAELNNKKLLSDSACLKASCAGNLINMCSILLTEMQNIDIGNAFIDLLESFENTKVLAKRLSESLNIVEPDGVATIKQTKSTPVIDAPLFASRNIVADSAVALNKSSVSKSKSSVSPDKPLFTSNRVEADSAVPLSKSSVSKSNNSVDPDKPLFTSNWVEADSAVPLNKLSVSKSKSSVDPDKPLFTSNRVEADGSKPLFHQSTKSKAKAPPLDNDKPLFSSNPVVADGSIPLGLAKSDKPVSDILSTLKVDQPLFTSKRVVSDSSIPVGVVNKDKALLSMPLPSKGGESKSDAKSLNIDELLFKSNRVVVDSSVPLGPGKQEKPVASMPLPLNNKSPLPLNNDKLKDSNFLSGKPGKHTLRFHEPLFKSNRVVADFDNPAKAEEAVKMKSRKSSLSTTSSDSGTVRATEHLSGTERSSEPEIVINNDKQESSVPTDGSSSNEAESSVQKCITSGDGSDDEAVTSSYDSGMCTDVTSNKRSSPEASSTEDSDAFLTASSNVSSPESASYERFSIETDLHIAEDSISTVKSIPYLNEFEDASASHDTLVLAKEAVTPPPPPWSQEQRQLKVAVLQDDAVHVEKVLSEGATLIDEPLEDGCTVLMLAAKEDRQGVMPVLLRHKASLSLTDLHGRTALYHAVQNGNYEIVITLVREQTADVNGRNDDGVPLLVEAASRGFSMIAETLLENGANPDLATPDGVTPLYAACSNSHIDTVQMLLKYHADVNKVCRKTRKTPLEAAIEGKDPEIVKSLMEAIATANKKSMELFECVSAENVKTLVSKGAKVDTRNHDDATPLIVHCDSEHIEVVKELVRLRANIDLQDKDGYSALMMSAKRGNLELVQILVKAGAILDFKEKQTGYTALMFGIVCDNARVVKELVLARANTAIRNRDGHSCLDLARERQCPQVMDTLELQPSNQPSGGDDPFTELLSEYMREKKQDNSLSSVPADEGAKNKSSKKKPQQHTSSSTPSSAESDGILIAEIRKKERRIADLETRIHDLTSMQGYKPLDDETNVSYMERGRLEAEYKKLKEAKKKAEQYSIEAKQTAQRLSAENFKLREDLSKEKHLNELRHKNMLKEVEQQYKRRGSSVEMEVARKEVFQREVNATAAEILKNDPTRGRVFERVVFTEDNIREIMTKSAVRIGLFHILISGLPYSGKTNMMKSIVKKDTLKDDNFLNLYEVILNRNILGAHEWVEAPKLEAEISHFLFAFAYFFVKHHQLPKFDKTIFKIYDDPEVQKHFENTFNDLQKLLLRFDNENDIQLLLSQSLNLVNVYDAGVNKAVNEFLMATCGRNKSFFLVNVIDMFRYDGKALSEAMDLTELRKYNKKASELQFHKSHSAIHHFAAQALVASITQLDTNTLIVGTHKDKFVGESAEEMIEERKKVLMNMFDAEAAQCGIPPDSYHPEMITIDARSQEDCERVKDALIKLIDLNRDKIEIDLPVSYLFLRCVLFLTKQIFISRKELLNYAKKCLINLEEVEDFLTIFRNCGSIISSDNPSDFLFEYVILLPCDFLRDLNKLYNVGISSSIPENIKERAKYGFISDQLLRSLWQGVSGSEGSLSLSDVYSQVLQNVYLMVEIGKGEYFMPSLRREYCEESPGTNSLIIMTNSLFIPFNRQCDFMRNFIKQFKDIITIADTECFNKTVLIWKESDCKEIEITIKIHRDFFEISMTPLINEVCGVIGRVKRACVEVMKSITEYMPKFQFDLAIMCSNHFVNFKRPVKELKCKKCASVIPEQDPRMVWVNTAIEGNQHHSEDLLKPSKFLDLIKDDDLASLTTANITLLAERLGLKDTVKSTAGKDLKDLLFDVLYKWHDHNLSLTKQDLIELLEKCGLYKGAVKLGSTTLVDTGRTEVVNETTFTNKQLRLVASSWPHNFKELAHVLKVDLTSLGQSFTNASDDETKCSEIVRKWLELNNGDRWGRLADIMEKKEYFNISQIILNFA